METRDYTEKDYSKIRRVCKGFTVLGVKATLRNDRKTAENNLEIARRNYNLLPEDSQDGLLECLERLEDYINNMEVTQ